MVVSKVLLIWLFLFVFSYSSQNSDAHKALKDKNYEKAFKIFTEHANKGNSNAQSNLGYLYEYGKGIKKDHKKAFVWYKKAANSGSSYSQKNLAEAYLYGYGVKKNNDKAEEWYLKAANNNDKSAMSGLAYFYRNTLKDSKKAIKWLDKLVKKKDKNAITTIARIYKRGTNNVKKDIPKAIEYLQKGIKLKSSYAASELASLYRYDTKEYAKALKYYKKAFELGSTYSATSIAYMYRDGLGVKKSNSLYYDWNNKGAKKGDSSALYNLGKIYEEGFGKKIDINKSLSYYEQASKKGNYSANRKLGGFYEYGEYVDKDYKKAFTYYKKSNSYSSLARLYEQGKGLKQDYSKALEYYKKDKWSKESKYQVGRYYLQGLGVEKNLKTSYEWFLKAAKSGNAKAQLRISQFILSENPTLVSSKDAAAWQEKSRIITWSYGKLLEKEKLKKIFTKYKKKNQISKLNTAQKISALTDFYYKQNDNAPIAPNMVKGEFETTDKFNERVSNKRIAYDNQLNEYKFTRAFVLKKSMLSAIRSLYGKVQLSPLKYDADSQLFYSSISSQSGDFKQKIAINVPLNEARNFKKNFKNISNNVEFEILGDKLLLKKVITKYKKSAKKRRTINKYYTTSMIDTGLNSKPMEVKFKNSIEEYSPTMISVGVDEELMKLQKQNINLQREKALLQKQKAKRLALKNEKERLNSLNAQLTTNSGGYDDLPALLEKMPRAKIDKKKWLIMIAIEDYEYTDNIVFTSNSAQVFKDVTQKLLGIDSSHTIYLDNKNATSGSIKGRLKSILRRVKKDDQIYFYYSGHGIPVAAQGNEPYMLPNDIIPEYIQDESFFKLNNIYNLFSNSKASKVIAVVDSCFSGATDNINIIKGVAATRLKPKKVTFNKNKMVVLSAGRDKQYANKYDKKSHRLFSYFVMKSLIKGERSVDKLYEDVHANVSDESFEMGDLKLQEPTVNGNQKITF